jgi:hypothetical protein
MKNYILLLLLATFGMQAQTLQNPTYGNVKLKNNQTSTTATKVNVQETDGTINTISKADLVNVIEVNDVPSLPLIGEAGKIYVVKNLNKIYRWNGTYYTELAVTDITYQSVIDALTFTPENVVNKSNSYTASSTTTYPNTKALVDGLDTKISGTLTTNRIPKSFGTKSIGDSSINDNGTTVTTNLPIHANSFVKSIGSTNLLLASGSDITQASLPISTATQTALNLKANLASPTFTGTPTAPTPTTTTGIANKSYVDGLDSGNVKLTGPQVIAGVKTFTNDIVLNGGVLSFLGSSSLQTGNPSIYRLGNRLALNVEPGGKNVILDGNAISSSITLNLQNSSGTLALTSNPTSLTATSFIKSSAPTTNILLAGGGDLAQNTAFNKNFGITAGTVVEGNDSRINNGQTAFGWGNHAGKYYNRVKSMSILDCNLQEDGIITGFQWTNAPVSTIASLKTVIYSPDWIEQEFTSIGTTTNIWTRTRYSGTTWSGWLLTWTENNFNPASYLPLSGGTLTGTVTATSYTATSLPVFENNAAASSLAVGQFYRTSIGVLMVKF